MNFKDNEKGTIRLTGLQQRFFAIFEKFSRDHGSSNFVDDAHWMHLYCLRKSASIASGTAFISKNRLSNVRLKHFNIDLGAQIFLACSDTSRLRILTLIMINGEMCISDLEHILDFTQAKTSRHLIYLKNSGILSSRKMNQWVFYQIKEEVQDILKQMLEFIRRDPALQKDQQIFQTLFTNRELALNKLHMRPLGHHLSTK
jgi:ArsR family transcriptional regulator